jgi:hypothetical protein
VPVIGLVSRAGAPTMHAWVVDAAPTQAANIKVFK